MKLSFSKFNKNRLPPPEVLRPKLFEVSKFWFIGLGLSIFIFLVVTFVGLKLFYNQYFKNQDELKFTENVENLMSIDRLKKAVEKRNTSINAQLPATNDPAQ